MIIVIIVLSYLSFCDIFKSYLSYLIKRKHLGLDKKKLKIQDKNQHEKLRFTYLTIATPDFIFKKDAIKILFYFHTRQRSKL